MSRFKIKDEVTHISVKIKGIKKPLLIDKRRGPQRIVTRELIVNAADDFPRKISPNFVKRIRGKLLFMDKQDKFMPYYDLKLSDDGRQLMLTNGRTALLAVPYNLDELHIARKERIWDHTIKAHPWRYELSDWLHCEFESWILVLKNKGKPAAAVTLSRIEKLLAKRNEYPQYGTW